LRRGVSAGNRLGDIVPPRQMENHRSIKLGSHVLYVSVGAEARIVGEVPARMIRVVVNHDLIARPVPVADDGVIVRKNAPVKVLEPEPFAVSPLQVEYMLGADASGEVTMCPRVIKVEPGVVAARV